MKNLKFCALCSWVPKNSEGNLSINRDSSEWLQADFSVLFFRIENCSNRSRMIWKKPLWKDLSAKLKVRWISFVEFSYNFISFLRKVLHKSKFSFSKNQINVRRRFFRLVNRLVVFVVVFVNMQFFQPFVRSKNARFLFGLTILTKKQFKNVFIFWISLRLLLQHQFASQMCFKMSW